MFTAAQVSALQAATDTASARIDKAIDWLENHPETVAEHACKSSSNFNLMADPENRQKMLNMLRKAQKALHSGKIPFQFAPNYQSKTEGNLYTNFWGNWVTSSVMYVGPDFFTHDTKVEDVVHELGRFYNSLGEESTGTWNDVKIWDNVIESLSNPKRDINAAKNDINPPCARGNRTIHKWTLRLIRSRGDKRC